MPYLYTDTKPRPRAAATPDSYANHASREAKAAAEHDRAVSGCSPAALAAMAKDLGARHVHNLRDPESRWVLGRRAAVLRKLGAMQGGRR